MVRRAQELLDPPGETKQIFSLDELQWREKHVKNSHYSSFEEPEDGRENGDQERGTTNSEHIVLKKHVLWKVEIGLDVVLLL